MCPSSGYGHGTPLLLNTHVSRKGHHLTGRAPDGPSGESGSARHFLSFRFEKRAVVTSCCGRNRRAVVIRQPFGASVPLFTPLRGAAAHAVPPGTFQQLRNMTMSRNGHTETLLADGSPLVAGGTMATSHGSVGLRSAELFDPVTNTFTRLGLPKSKIRSGHTAVRMQDGRVGFPP